MAEDRFDEAVAKRPKAAGERHHSPRPEGTLTSPSLNADRIGDDTRALLAAKLQLTSLALNCTTHKEICARFSSVNALTAFTPQNAYKWLKGKATPRLSSVYSDWAAVLGGHLTPTFIATSSIVEFSEALRISYALSETAISRVLQVAQPAAAADAALETIAVSGDPASHWLAEHVLPGRYLAISPAWSPLEAGQLVVGHVDITLLDGHRSMITYRENLFDRSLVLSGEMVTDDRYAQAILYADFARRKWMLNLHMPPFPASLLAGLLSGSAVIDFDGRLMTSRFLLIRDYNNGTIGSLSGYAAPEPHVVDEWLALLGYQQGDERLTFAEQTIAFVLGNRDGSLIDVPPEDQRALGLALDKLAPLEGRRPAARDLYSSTAKIKSLLP
ncbi:hypothetical protein [Chelatococcus asaccharovorans]|uniref:hypothetical protein n=1 Tax=Chelatococcus asaccharovorans TaxID=28210 RepID=UPI00224C7492|nr:hypothetical protein [Chelatococcus asaccharovorans]CAH1672123.1 conserved hypothetical protein [Chelatococcus asaccharovorans]CAH1676469.1 conserved hypothetical protein [Chelatococcus asaccharovorans]